MYIAVSLLSDICAFKGQGLNLTVGSHSSRLPQEDVRKASDIVGKSG